MMEPIQKFKSLSKSKKALAIVLLGLATVFAWERIAFLRTATAVTGKVVTVDSQNAPCRQGTIGGCTKFSIHIDYVAADGKTYSVHDTSLKRGLDLPLSAAGFAPGDEVKMHNDSKIHSYVIQDTFFERWGPVLTPLVLLAILLLA